MFIYSWFRLYFGKFLGLFRVVLMKSQDIERLNSSDRLARSLLILGEGGGTSHIPIGRTISMAKKSKSQLGQDLLALSYLPVEKNTGFFVEFGATDGIALSNTYLLETEFGWSGILVEPANSWHGELRKNRKVIIDTRCVYGESGAFVDFDETRMKEYSTISEFSKGDGHSFIRVLPNRYKVETVSLLDLLDQHGAPPRIDLITIDTEGSEFEILKAFEFDKYSFGVMCVEHNFTANREKTFSLLSSKGYRRVLTELSLFDDWYVNTVIT
jgi:FkbM family methyltransferase